MKTNGLVRLIAAISALLVMSAVFAGCSKEDMSSTGSDIRSNISSMTSKVESAFDTGSEGSSSADSSMDNSSIGDSASSK